MESLGQAQVDLFASRQTSHCPLWLSLTHPAPLADASFIHLSPIALLTGERVHRDGVHLLLKPRSGRAEYGSQT